MCAHIEALFAHDNDGQLVRVNEPNGAPAPRFFLGRTGEGPVWRFRYDVEPVLRRGLEVAIGEDDSRDAFASPVMPSPYQEILRRAAPVEKTWTGPTFYFPPELPASAHTILVGEDNAETLRSRLEAWLPDVGVCQPMVVLLLEGYAVSICASVRRTAVAHEAGVETAPAFRGRGYAVPVVAAWARAVRELARVPLYSTSWHNESSRAVARKLGLIQFGSDLHIT